MFIVLKCGDGRVVHYSDRGDENQMDIVEEKIQKPLSSSRVSLFLLFLL